MGFIGFMVEGSGVKLAKMCRFWGFKGICV